MEIPTANFERAVKFYSLVLKLYLESVDCGNSERMACFPTGEGAIIYSPDFAPSGNGAIVSFSVPDSIEATTQRIEEHGGEVVIPKTKIEAEGRGYFAVCIDSEGNRFGLYE